MATWYVVYESNPVGHDCVSWDIPQLIACFDSFSDAKLFVDAAAGKTRLDSLVIRKEDDPCIAYSPIEDAADSAARRVASDVQGVAKTQRRDFWLAVAGMAVGHLIGALIPMLSG